MKAKPLTWYGDESWHVGYLDCNECLSYMQHPGLWHAAASVGIEHGKSSGEMIRATVGQYHGNGHRRVLSRAK
jgi:hypothetical protein